MKRRSRLRFVARATPNQFEMPCPPLFDEATRSVALQTLCDPGHGLSVAKPLEHHATRHFHLFPKGTALSKIMGRDAIRRFLDFI
jgi:hypothetical protein